MRDPDVERHVVLKRYRAGSGEAEEGRALGKVASLFVARCYGVERLDGELYLVVEYVPGRNLDEVRREGPLDAARVVRVLVDLAEGVAAVHARVLVHRDIKPANVILHDDGRPRLVDFGLAAHLGSPRLFQRAGSPSYMAPEQARGQGERVDHRVDVFGLGGVLYAPLTGFPPYRAADIGSALALAEKAEFPPRQLDPRIPRPVEAVCLKAMAAAPENRHGSAKEFRRALKRAWLVVRVRRRLSPVAAVFLVLGVATWLRPQGASPRSATLAGSMPFVPSEAPIEADLAVTLYKDENRKQAREVCALTDRTIGTDPPRLNDLVRVHINLSRPTHGYLLALNPDGGDQVCLRLAPPRRELDFPEAPSGFLRLTDGVGMQAFVLVASERPLPVYESWKAQIPGDFGWKPPADPVLWSFHAPTGSGPASCRGELRGDVVQRDPAPDGLFDLCDRLRKCPGVGAVHGVAFPVAPEDDTVPGRACR